MLTLYVDAPVTAVHDMFSELTVAVTVGTDGAGGRVKTVIGTRTLGT